MSAAVEIEEVLVIEAAETEEVLGIGVAEIEEVLAIEGALGAGQGHRKGAEAEAGAGAVTTAGV